MFTGFAFRAVVVFVGSLCYAAGPSHRRIINKAADVPPFVYSLSDSAQEIVRSPEAFARFARPVQADLVRLQSDYNIQNDAVQRRVLETLAKLDLLTGDYHRGIERAKRLKELQTKTALRLTTMLIETAYMQSARDTGDVHGDAFQSAFRDRLRAAVTALPYDAAWASLVGIRGFAERDEEPVLLGDVSQDIEPARKKNGTLTWDLAWQLVNKRCEYVLLAVRKPTMDVIRKQEVMYGVPKGIWPERSITLDKERPLTPVTVAIWDRGVDPSLFPGRLVPGIAFDPNGKRSTEWMWPLTPEEKQLDHLSALAKGNIDVIGDPDSPEAQLFRDTIAHTSPDKIGHLLGELEHFRRASHGTMCAFVAAVGNPFVRILSARAPESVDMIQALPTPDWEQAHTKVIRELVQYLRDQKVRVVNMSFGDSPAEIEQALEQHGGEHDLARRKEQARQAFEIEKRVMFEAISGSPEILFVAAAGNSDENTSDAEGIPGGFKLPNLITVGAVDPVGNAASFTRFGPTVSVYAFGFERARSLGGREMFFVGTSSAAPGVVNLAAKLLAVQPNTTPQQLIELINRGGSRNESEGILVLNPKRSMQLLKMESDRSTQ